MFRDLYAAVQTKSGRISTRWLRDEAIKVSNFTLVREMWSAVVDATATRGFYIEGPLNPPMTLLNNQALIVLSRAMCCGPNGKPERRFTYTKELMHVFDQEDEKAHDSETLDALMTGFMNPAENPSKQFNSESKAYWRALAVLCSEQERHIYKKKLDSGDISIEVVATALRIPIVPARWLFATQFEKYLSSLMDG